MQLTSVQVTRERDLCENALAVRVRYNIILVNTSGNNVFVVGVG